jgi:hypothetical protein
VLVKPEQIVRRKFKALKGAMDERMKRLWAGAEAEAIGYGGIAAVSRATRMAISTVQKGRNKLRAGADGTDLVTVRRKGGGRPPHDKVHPELIPALQKARRSCDEGRSNVAAALDVQERRGSLAGDVRLAWDSRER